LRGYQKLQERVSSSKPITAICASRQNFSKTLTALENRRAAASKNITSFNTGERLGDEFFFRNKERDFSKNIQTIKMESKQVKKLAKMRKQIMEGKKPKKNKWRY